jgi:hypothetical protein
MTTTPPSEPTEEELRASYEAEIKRLRVEQIVLEGVVTIINLGMRRSGLVPGSEDERDASQVQVAIEAVRAQLPLLEQVAPAQVGPIRDALSQLQLAYVRMGGQVEPEPREAGGPASRPAAGAPREGEPQEQAQPGSEPIKPGEPGPAQRSGRLWVPGQ